MLVLEGFNVLNATNQTNSATAFVVLEEWSKRNKPELRARALTAKLQQEISAAVRGAVVLCSSRRRSGGSHRPAASSS